MSRKRRYKTNVGDSATFEEEKTPESVVEEKSEESVFQKYTVDSLGGLRLRKGPSLNDEIITVLKNNQVVKIDIVEDPGDWGRVTLDDDRIGWVMMKFVKKL